MLLKYTPSREQVMKFLKTIEDRTKKNQIQHKEQLHEPRL
jgi:Fe2+ or Zn2+ uptake regulation protein